MCSTIGVEMAFTKIQCGDVEVGLHFWDTAGQERFGAVVGSYYRGSHIVIVVLNADSRGVPENHYLREWLGKIMDAKRQDKTPFRAFVALNKVDLSTGNEDIERAYARYNVTDFDLKSFVDEKVFSVSAKSGEGMKVLLDRIIAVLTDDPEFLAAKRDAILDACDEVSRGRRAARGGERASAPPLRITGARPARYAYGDDGCSC